MSESVQHLCGTGLETYSSREEAVFDKCECWTYIRKCIRKHQSGPEIVNCLLYDSTDNRTLAKEWQFSWPHSKYQFRVDWPTSPRYVQIGRVRSSGNNSSPCKSLQKEKSWGLAHLKALQRAPLGHLGWVQVAPGNGELRLGRFQERHWETRCQFS